MVTDVAEALSTVVNQQTVALGGHEVRVAVNVTRSVEPGENLVHEGLNLVVGTTSSELGDPDRAAGCYLASIVDVVLEVGGVGCIIIPAQS